MATAKLALERNESVIQPHLRRSMSSFQIVSVCSWFALFFIRLLTYDVWPRYNGDSTPIGGLALLSKPAR